MRGPLIGPLIEPRRPSTDDPPAEPPESPELRRDRIRYSTPELERLGGWQAVTLQSSIPIFP